MFLQGDIVKLITRAKIDGFINDIGFNGYSFYTGAGDRIPQQYFKQCEEEKSTFEVKNRRGSCYITIRDSDFSIDSSYAELVKPAPIYLIDIVKLLSSKEFAVFPEMLNFNTNIPILPKQVKDKHALIKEYWIPIDILTPVNYERYTGELKSLGDFVYLNDEFMKPKSLIHNKNSVTFCETVYGRTSFSNSTIKIKLLKGGEEVGS